MGFPFLVAHCPWSSFPLGRENAHRERKSGNSNQLQAALCSWALHGGTRWEIFFHDLVQDLRLVMGLLQHVLDAQMDKVRFEVQPCLRIPLGFSSGPLAGWHLLSLSYLGCLFLSMPLSIFISNHGYYSLGVWQLSQRYSFAGIFFFAHYKADFHSYFKLNFIFKILARVYSSTSVFFFQSFPQCGAKQCLLVKEYHFHAL